MMVIIYHMRIGLASIDLPPPSLIPRNEWVWWHPVVTSLSQTSTPSPLSVSLTLRERREGGGRN